MKANIYKLLSIIIMTFFLASCQGAEPKSISDYIKFAENSAYVYAGSGVDSASQTVYIDYTHPESQKYQRRIVAGDETVLECAELKDDSLILYFNDPRAYYFRDMTNQEPNNGIVVLQEPLTLGQKWERGKSMIRISQTEERPVIITAEITGVDVDVTVPYGTFKALELTVTTEGTEEYSKEYYAEGIGLIKTFSNSTREHFEGEDSKFVGTEYVEVTTELERIDENATYVSDEYFYYPNFVEKKLDREEHSVIHNTNEDPRAVFEREINTYENDYMKTLLEGVKINSVDVDYAKGRVRVDFSSEVMSRIRTLSQQDETLALQALINTVAYYNNVQTACITFEGEGYNSANISLSNYSYIGINGLLTPESSEQQQEDSEDDGFEDDEDY